MLMDGNSFFRPSKDGANVVTFAASGAASGFGICLARQHGRAAARDGLCDRRADGRRPRDTVCGRPDVQVFVADDSADVYERDTARAFDVKPRKGGKRVSEALTNQRAGEGFFRRRYRTRYARSLRGLMAARGSAKTCGSAKAAAGAARA